MRIFLLLTLMISISGFNTANAKDEYKIDHKWGKALAGYGLGQTTGVGVDSHNHVFVFHRASRTGGPFTSFIAENTVLMLDGTSGEILNEWGANSIRHSHGLAIDSDDNVWLTDVGGHVVHKFSHDGDQLLTLGTLDESGDDENHFNKPAGVSFSSNGDVFIADGYINTRVAKFTADGKYIKSWGKPGTGNGEFDLVHAISISSDDIVYVADRTNSRIQVFDTEGKFIKIIPQKEVGRPFGVAIAKKGNVFVIDGGIDPDDTEARFIALNKDGKAKAEFDTNFDQNDISLGHGIAIGNGGAIYVADVRASRVVKLVKRK